MKQVRFWLWLVWLIVLMKVLVTPAAAHDVPLSHVDLRLKSSAVTAYLRLPWTGLTADLPALGPVASMAPEDGESRLKANRDAITGLILPRLTLTADGQPLTEPEVTDLQLSEDRSEVRLSLLYPYRDTAGRVVPPPQTLHVQTRLFPSDPRCKTLLRLYRGVENDKLEREEFLTFSRPEVTHTVGGGQSVPAIIGQFIREGIHHIFIGPDHILFVIGLLLAGGGLRHILKIVTAFTLAHSLTLALAALGIYTPPSKAVEAVIALSIVFVGVDVLLKSEGRELGIGTKTGTSLAVSSIEKGLEKDGLRPTGSDRRLFYAFAFGLIHGFGFASVMGELDLPRYALSWTLVSFNVGVEIGQACIIAIALPILTLLTRWRPKVAHIVILLGAVGVTAAGAYWFIERILS